MSVQNQKEIIEQVRKAYRANNLTLYLGAGVSMGNGLPSWDKLVLAMYFSAIKRDDIVEGIRPFPNYLFAIAEWHLERRKEPLDITARKIRNLYADETLFLDKLHETLYAGFEVQNTRTIKTPNVASLRNANPTLRAVADLCKKRSSSRARVNSVISYNYDNLLELAIKDAKVQPIWRADQRLKRGGLPVYHVHGFIPIEGTRSTLDEVVFTEEQYYLAAQNAYSWSNLTQIKHLSNSVGLMIGLSVTDRNMRRLLDALKKTPLTPENYVILQKPQWPAPDKNCDLKRIDEKAKLYSDRFRKSGRKTDEKKYTQIEEIIAGVEESDFHEQQVLLEKLGVYPIWYTNHAEVPAIIKSIANA
ncbi:MAG: SIR2 family protein [Pyrinomonadaceae bacterium]|nr:SIR2 family protein [Pyrinomonadaceae bacterium]